VAVCRHCPRSTPKLSAARQERHVQPVGRSVAAATGVPSPVKPVPLPPYPRFGSTSQPCSAPRRDVEPPCELSLPVACRYRGPWRTTARCTHHALGATRHAHPEVSQTPAEGEMKSAARTVGPRRGYPSWLQSPSAR
jgi:hypothetical protein